MSARPVRHSMTLLTHAGTNSLPEIHSCLDIEFNSLFLYKMQNLKMFGQQDKNKLTVLFFIKSFNALACLSVLAELRLVFPFIEFRFSVP